MKKKNFLLFLIPSLSILLISACSSAKVEQNAWRTTAINIDGNANEWKTNLKQVGDQKVWLATTNDDKFFYMCLVIEDRNKVMQMMRAGFITWFTPSKNQESTFGVKYPLSNKLLPQEEKQNVTREMFQESGIEKIVNMILQKQTEIQILNSEKYSLSLLPLGNSDGIRAKIGYSEGKLVYELQVPLTVHEDYSYQIAAVPGEDVKVKFETEELDLSSMRPGNKEETPSDGIPEGGGSHGGMRRGGGMSGVGGQGRMSMSEPFNYTTDIKLALPK